MMKLIFDLYNSTSKCYAYFLVVFGFLLFASSVVHADDVVEFHSTPTVNDLMKIIAPDEALVSRSIQQTPRTVINRHDGKPLVEQQNVPHERINQKAQPVGRTQKVSFILPIQFDVNSDRILPAHTPHLDVVGQLLTSSPNLKIAVEGHTDTTGSDNVNNSLSAFRAFSVARYLNRKFKIAIHRFLVKGYGSRKLLLPKQPTHPRNRRVEFLVFKQDDL